MTQGKNKTPQTQAPTLGTLLATALGIAYGAWAEAKVQSPGQPTHH